MQKFDLLIVGGGMVGLTLALAVRQQTQLKVAIADINTPAPLTEQAEVRVSAINVASQQIFANLGVWPAIQTSRLQPYHHMHIWDKAGYGKLDFSLDDVNCTPKVDQLGWIIENNVIRTALWQKAQADDGIVFFTKQALSQLTVGDSEVFASFTATDKGSNQAPILAKLLVGADGANSWVRQQMQIPLTFRDYDHHAIVATVKCKQGHQNTAWQVFLDAGPLAFLPLYQQGSCSIVWSTAPEDAERLMQLSAVDFAKELTAASDGKLGNIELTSERFCHPLTMRFAQEFVQDKVALIGDAAHTIHPLAGQGVNLGLLDAAALAQTFAEQIDAAQVRGEAIEQQWLSTKALQQFARWRKSDASEMIAAMETIKQTFSPKPAAVKMVRGLGMSLLNKVKPLKSMMIKQALGFKGELPRLAKSIECQRSERQDN